MVRYQGGRDFEVQMRSSSFQTPSLLQAMTKPVPTRRKVGRKACRRVPAFCQSVSMLEFVTKKNLIGDGEA